MDLPFGSRLGNSAGNKSKKARLKRCSCLLPSSSVVAYSAHATFVSLQLVYPPRLPFNFLSVSLFLPCCLVGKKHAFSRMIVDEVNINRELGISSKVVVHALWNGCGTLLSWLSSHILWYLILPSFFLIQALLSFPTKDGRALIRTDSFRSGSRRSIYHFCAASQDFNWPPFPDE